MTDEERLYFNGINGATGSYELPPLSPEEVASVALGERINEEVYRELKNRHTSMEAHFGVNADQTNLAETGWGVVFAAKDPRTDALREALQPLLDLRRAQATQDDERLYREFSGGAGYRPGESYLDFLGRHGMGPGPADPTKVPYYLLLVGDPEQIPYRFQYQLDVQYAVGRLALPSLEAYAQYAESVVAAEKEGRLQLPRRAVFFGVRNENDRATQLSTQELIRPLSKEMADLHPNWEIALTEETNKANLGALLGGDATPALLFTASHGMGFPNGDPRQLRHQGALLCSDWPGPRDWKKVIPEDFYFSADDVGSDARLAGMLGFFFACYGAGTPHLDAFSHKALDQREELAPHAFIAQLPQRLLGHPKGSALAVVGHVERAWGYSFMWSGAGRQLGVFQETLDQLMDGYPIGAAIEWFNERHAELSVVLASEIEEIKEFDKRRDDVKLAGMWTANKDARSYVILGDPAVRLPVAAEDAPAEVERPTITVTHDRLEALQAAETAEEAETGADAASDTGPETVSAQAAPVTEEDFAVAFGLRDQFSGLTESLRTFTDQLADALSRAARDITTLEVKTYTTADISAVSESEEPAADLRALTHVAFDGDTKVFVPAGREGVDEGLWQIHLEMVREAQKNRAQFLQAMAEMATNLLKSLKP